MVFTVKIHSTETIYTTEIKFCACVNNGNLRKKTLKKYRYKFKNCELHKNQWSNEKNYYIRTISCRFYCELKNTVLIYSNRIE